MIGTFYSYKGGVGRSMALANIAELLFRRGFKVLMIDWDLEAPGLESYFPSLEVDTTRKQPGVVDMVLDYKRLLAGPPTTKKVPLPPPVPDFISYLLEVYPDHGRLPGAGQLWLLPSGRRAGDEFDRYGQFVRTFDWQDFYRNWEGESFIEWLRAQANNVADVVFVDSRTGVTELGGICTYQLADVIVMFCGPNTQNLDGTQQMAASFTNPKLIPLRRGRPLHVLIVPARVEDRAEIQDLTAFRDEFLIRFGHTNFGEEHALAQTAEDLWKLKIPHVPYYAFREDVVTRDPRSVRHEDLYKAFTQLAKALTPLLGLQMLTTAELRLLPLMSTHLSFREIAERLYISQNTVKTQAISIYRKLGVSSRSGAVERAQQLGLDA